MVRAESPVRRETRVPESEAPVAPPSEPLSSPSPPPSPSNGGLFGGSVKDARERLARSGRNRAKLADLSSRDKYDLYQML